MSEKVENQKQLFASTREALLTKVVQQKSAFTRDEWNALLKPAGVCAFTTADLEELNSAHTKAIQAAREKAVKDSVLELATLRKSQVQVKAFCGGLPKGAILHEHANGTMTRKTAQKLLEMIDPVIDAQYILEKTKDPNIELFAAEQAFIERIAGMANRRYSEHSEDDRKALIDLFFLPNAPYDHSFKRFSFPFLVFPIMRDKTKDQFDPDLLQIEEFLHRVHAMGIRYVELTKGVRFDPKSLSKLHENAVSLFEKTGVILRWNYAFFRNADPEKIGESAEKLLQGLESYASEELVGVDILANEETAPAFEAGQRAYAHVMAAALGVHPKSKVKLRRTFHAGELGLTENVRDALVLGAERVGHGVKMRRDPVTLEIARQMRLGVEVSPVSNLRLRVVKDLKEHPFLDFLRLGLKVSISTDDEGVLETDINNECARLVSETDITYAELRQMAYNSVETSFATDVEKKALKEWLDAAYADFEKTWKKKLGAFRSFEPRGDRAHSGFSEYQIQ